MSNLFESLGNQQPQPQNLMQAVQQIKTDPAVYLRNRGFNIPSNVDVRNPQAIINSLMQTGQVGVSRHQQALQTIQGMRRR